MEDSVRPSAETFRSVYEESFQKWYRLYDRALKDPALPACCFRPQDLFPQHPRFPPTLHLRHVKTAGYSHIWASGYSTWGSSQTHCEHSIPPFMQELEIEVGAGRVIPLCITKDQHSSCMRWFRGDHDYLAVLILAWAYILSARWAEIMPEACKLAYTSTQEASQTVPTTDQQQDQDTISLDIGDASSEEARWWTAILAPGQGWQATMTLGEDTCISRWSVCLPSAPTFQIVSRAPLPKTSVHSVPSFVDAMTFMDRFCRQKNATDQCHAALAAALLLPSTRVRRAVDLPFPITSTPTQSTQTVLPRHDADNSNQFQDSWLGQANHLDRLLTLSCNTRGIRSMLLSVFHEPSIECNTATPWLQGATAVLDPLIDDNPVIVGRICMDRAPRLSFLWLGSVILGLQKRLLQELRFGFIPLDLHSEVWSRTTQSFIQRPVSGPLAVDGYVSRADECRMLFLSQTDRHARVPFCPWDPFGRTPLEEADLEVRVHADCRGHGLEYRGFRWNCTDGVEWYIPAQEASTTTECDSDVSEAAIKVDYAAMDRDNEDVSKNATRSIMGWLRFDGHAPCEREIWKHGWFDIFYSDDEDEEGQTDGGSKGGLSSRSKSSSAVQTWVDKLE